MIRIGLVGMGYLGAVHLKVLQGLSAHFEIAGVFDHNEAKLQACKLQNPNITTFSSYHELLQNADAIGIVASTPAHFELAKKAIQAKKAVFVEKPMCALLTEAEALQALLIQNPLVFQVGHVERFNPLIMALQPMLDQHKIQSFSSNRAAPFQLRGAEVSVVLDLMIHDIDLLLLMHPFEIAHIAVEAKQVQSQQPDEVLAHIHFTNGCSAELFASRLAVQRSRSLNIQTDQGTFNLDLIKQELLFESTSFEPQHIQVPDHNALAQQWLEFAGCIEQQTMPKAGVEAGIKALQLALQIDRAAKNYILNSSSI